MPWPHTLRVQPKGCWECDRYSQDSIWSQLPSQWTIRVLQARRSPGNKKPAPESEKSTQKSSLATIPSVRIAPQTRSAKVGKNWHFSLRRLSSGQIFACSADSLHSNWRVPCQTSPFGEPPFARAEMAQQGACPKPWKCPSLALVPSNGTERRRRRPKREWKQRGRSNHQPEALDAQRWSWTDLEARGTERRHSHKLKPWVSKQSNNSRHPKIKSSACNRSEI